MASNAGPPNTGPTRKRDSGDDRKLQVRVALIGAVGAIIAAAAGAIIGLKPWSDSSPSPGPPSSSASGNSSVPSSQCVFLAPVEVTCTSSDPTVIIEYNNDYNSTGCSFSAQVSWGDESPVQTINFSGRGPGPIVLGDHEYNQKGTYTITGLATSAFDLCGSSSATGIFTLG